jgi:hypothetical protein
MGALGFQGRGERLGAVLNGDGESRDRRQRDARRSDARARRQLPKKDDDRAGLGRATLLT